MYCITFAFSQCFMDYRCVFSMLKSCVLVGLDQAKPMMFLLIACHMFMYFSCIHTSLFYLIDIDIVWYSSACLSHTKRKSAPSRTLLILGHSLLLILLFLKVYIQQSLRSLSPMCYISRRYHILITPAVLIFGLYPKMNSCLFSVRHPHLRVTVQTPLTQTLQKV